MMPQVVLESIKRLYQSGAIKIEELDRLLTEKKINENDYKYITTY